MSSAHDGHKPSSPFGGSPFRTFFHRGSTRSPKLRALLQSFEETLRERFKALMPKDGSQVLTLPWMRSAVDSLSMTHVDVKALIADLEFPLAEWDGHWMDAYLDDSVKLLDICIALNSELSRLDQGQLFLQYALHSLATQPGVGSVVPSPERLLGAHRALRDWVRQVGSSKSPKLANSLTILQDLTGSLHQSTSTSSKLKKNSARAKVLMQAMYGVKVQTVFVCGALVAALSGSEATLLDLQAPDKFLWAEAFHEVQAAVNGEIRRSASRPTDGRGVLLREFDAVYASTQKLLAVITGCSDTDVDMDRNTTTTTCAGNSPDGIEECQGDDAAVWKKKSDELNRCLLDLQEAAGRLSTGMDKLSKQVNGFFQIVLTGRDALLCNLRIPGALEPDTK